MSQDENRPGDQHPLAFVAGGGEMGRLIRAFDWSKTPVGPGADWPQSLKVAVRIMTDSRYAMWLGWGPDFTFFYNDAYARMSLGPKHPWALGRSAREVWSEIWDDIGPRAESVVRTGQATWDEGLLLFLERRGFPEETYHTFSYSPLPDDQGGVGGMLCVVTEDTERTIGERRLRTLRELAARMTEQTKSAEDACRTATRTLAENRHDLPFLLIYLLDADGRTARLAGAAGLPEASSASSASPRCVDLNAAEGQQSAWPLRDVLGSGRAEVVTELGKRFGSLPGGVWPEPPEQAVVLPMARPGQARLAGFVVAGISPRLVFDDGYKGFMDLLAGQVATAVTNARAYEEERQRAEALAELDRAKTAFFSNVSHEFRTPLTLILGPVDDALAATDGELPPILRERLEVAHRNGLRLQRLVNTLLDFSRIEAGRVRATYEPTDLAAFTADLASNFRSACEKAGLELTVDCPPLGEPVFVDRHMWEKIVLNLLSNAFKFTFTGEIAVSILRAGRSADFRVRDTGTGIPPVEMPRLFERFHRVENARGRTHEGSGIGLALVHELVRLHGGSITAESEVGRGTTFLVTIPLGSAHLPPEQVGGDLAAGSTTTGAIPYVEEALRWLPDGRDDHDARSELPAFREDDSVPTSRQPGGDRPRVLVADDNSDMRRYVVRLLADQYAVEAVTDGAAALASVRRQPPDLILSDVMMPRLDGFELLRELRADPRTASVPVILLSARAGEESRVEGVQAGADDYLVKPFSSRELLARVSAHLQMARLRREANESLRASEERFRTLFESMDEAFCVVEMLYDANNRPADYRFLEANPTFGRHTGFTDAVGRTIRELVPDHDAHWFEIYGQVAATGEPRRFVNEAKAMGRWYDVYAYRVGGPDSCKVGILFTDITARKRAEESTLKQSEQLRRLAEVATRLNVVSDVASITGVVTEEARTLIGSHQAVTGFTTDQNWGQAINSVSLSEKYARWRGYDEKPDGSGIYALVCRTNEPLRMTQAELEEHPAYKRFGTHARHHPAMRGWLAAPLVGRDGRNIGLIQLSDKYEGEFTAEDEVILVQLAQMASVAIENARLVQDLRDADRRKDEFLATLAHELRNPLAPIRNTLQILKMPRLDATTVERSREMMERQVHQLVRLVDDLLDVSRVMRGKIELRKERVELATVFARAVETVQPLVESQGHELSVELPAESLALDADPIRLAQVIGNLLTNAAKYTEANGRIRLTARREGDDALVRVEDTGIGIAPDMLLHIFELFVQADHSSTKAQGGLGIGLTLVKNLVEMHHGTVEAHSDGLGMGSEFIIRLPLMPREERQRTEEDNGEASHESARSPGHPLLVVDDNRDAADSLAMLLRLQGYEVQVAHDGPAALRIAAASRPDLVFLDIGMPGMDGYEVARRLRRTPGLEKVVLAALTGWGQQEDRRRTADAGFDHHLVKPPEPKALENVLAVLKRKNG
jgi:PAS domain S-box-containing protein